MSAGPLSDLEEWEYAVAAGASVGTCSRCDGPMIPSPPEEVGGVVFLDARCASCGRETSAPGGKRTRPLFSLTPRRPAPSWRRVRDRDHAERAAGE